ncbi:hypothetical protein ABZ714_16980 [Streptomyces sp. NPDC006798]
MWAVLAVLIAAGGLGFHRVGQARTAGTASPAGRRGTATYKEV